MKQQRRPLDPDTARRWSDLGHMVFIDALTSSAVLQARQFAFHGGTSLHLSWRSPRFSEDLDFLLNRDLGSRMDELMPKIRKRMQDLLFAIDPDLSVEITPKTKPGSNLLNYRVAISSRKVIGNAKVKAEFWQVDPGYLDGYQTRFAYPLKDGDLVSRVSQPLPAATLEAAYADKLTAFATRTHLKWRDVFDLWWIGRQIEVDASGMAERFLHHVTAYDTLEGLPPAAALRRFLERDPEAIIAEADPDLRKWLPDRLWDSLRGDGVREMVATVRSGIDRIATEVETLASAQDRKKEPQDEYPDPCL
ncbi:nucleotidyl transferase AbiEii/AbiGii toxin family protein [Defluviimonas salinarum]|uniref:Nucleotidyl transferase AbiEii/AbiGii toxin family protein n=1 Tax=Defluviimonas salinarum TaxID=2992147 RepID=A0ABT3JA16_9RHOB|nr:nucleotidyl transferase AbiEii/AbiGii toxin family protein [Defluviimonas salinarum]MCW3784300.1 nucleotidyl transferase AbiEii/AbiGii toxin family protein [Defluviimonas salinarum]